jgi:hypothetical protein
MQQPDLFAAPLFQSRLYADTPRARATDPETSHEAADAIKVSGRLASQQGIVLKAVRAFPGLTSAELAMHCALDRYSVARRLPELEAARQVRKGERRVFRGRPGVTWLPT